MQVANQVTLWLELAGDRPSPRVQYWGVVTLHQLRALGSGASECEEHREEGEELWGEESHCESGERR